MRLTEDVAESAHEPFDRSVMNLWIDTLHVARGPLCAVLLPLKNKERDLTPEACRTGELPEIPRLATIANPSCVKPTM
jgi:hypothetical protein